jgi:hypothetical protein
MLISKCPNVAKERTDEFSTDYATIEQGKFSGIQKLQGHKHSTGSETW